MWKLYCNVESYKELLAIKPSNNYSSARTLQPIEGSSLIETGNQMVHIHTDEFWLQTPPTTLYLYCEQSGDGGETLVGNFGDLTYSNELCNLLSTLHFGFKKNNKYHSFKVLHKNVFRLNHSHIDMLNQISDKYDKELFNEYLKTLKKNTDVLSLLPGQGVIIDNHVSFHGRLAFKNNRKMIKVLGYDNTCSNTFL